METLKPDGGMELMAVMVQRWWGVEWAPGWLAAQVLQETWKRDGMDQAGGGWCQGRVAVGGGRGGGWPPVGREGRDANAAALWGTQKLTRDA